MVRNRALSIATRGLLAGSAIALVTGGLIQVGTGAAAVTALDSAHRHTSETVRIALPLPSPELVQPPRAGGGATLHYVDLPKHWRHVSEATLVLVGDSLARQSYKKPYVKPAPKLFYAEYESSGDLHLYGSAEWDYWDQQADDDDLIVMLALELFRR